MNTDEFLNGRLPCSSLESELIEFAKSKDKENASLINMLVNVTHHEGALDEHKEQWLPIVQKELESRMK